MTFQPQDVENDGCGLFEFIDDRAFENSQSSIQNPFTSLTFSPMTNIVDQPSPAPVTSQDNPSTLNEDSCGDEGDLLIPSDLDKAVTQLMANGNFDLDESLDSALDSRLVEELDMIELRNTDQSIQDRNMSVETQPPTGIRRRYQSDGKRQIEKSRSKPMAIKLPNLNNCELGENQSFWIQLVLITSSDNPMNKVYLHMDKLEYHADDLTECDQEFVRVMLTLADIQKGMKQLARISIIKKKLDAYTFDLVPFQPLSTNNQIDTYESENAKSVVAKAKRLRDVYHLESSRIACQLMIKKDTKWHITDIICETDIMEEKEKKSSKRAAASDNSDDDEDDYQVHHRCAAKKRKQSSTLMDGLPVTRVNEL